MDSPFGIGAMIFEAGGSGNLAKLKEIKEKVADVIEYQKICDVYSDYFTGCRVLNQAAEMGYLEICQFLIGHVGVQIEVVTYKGDTPLIAAAKENHVKIVEYLISQKALLQVANSKGFTSLHYAVLNGNLELMELLLKNNAPIESDSVDGTPLHCTASRGNVEAMQLLLARGAKLNFWNLFCGTPLLCAIRSQSFECVDLLLKSGADPNKFSYGLTHSAQAAQYSDTKYLKRLIEAGANPNLPSTGAVKPIVEAALANNLEAVKILFPLTSKIPDYPTWSVEGIMAYSHTEKAKTKRAETRNRCLESLDDLGKKEVNRQKYDLAIKWYNEASYLDPVNPKWLELRSMCCAHAGKGVDALRDSEECARLNAQLTEQVDPDHYGHLRREGGVAGPTPTWKLFYKYHVASLEFMLAPKENKNVEAFRVALFEYFSWLYMMSCPEEMATFLQHFF